VNIGPLSLFGVSDSATIIRDGEDVHRLQITHRDWMLINGPGFVEGPIFTASFGIFETLTVARGIPKGSLVHRDGQTLFDASSTLLAGIKRDLDVLRYDYSYKIGDHPKRFGGGQSISVDGRTGILSLRPKGYCAVRFVDRRTPDLIDLRNRDGFVTDAGRIKLYRRRAETRWLDILPPLIDFLAARLTKSLSLEHIDGVG
jgi:hypothetical protein